eukprot:scaffold26488_cov57-Attheya_sp.AAC.6
MVVAAGLPAEMQFESGGAYVKQQVSHIIKHSMKPDLPILLGSALKKVKEGAVSECGLRDVEGLLPDRDTMCEWAIPTHFYWSGWGSRALTQEELCLAWDLPALCVDRMVATNGESAKLFWSQPVVKSAPGNILHEIAHAFTVGAWDLGWLEPEGEEDSGAPVDSGALPPLPQLRLDPILGDREHMNWMDSTLITSKAVKSDKAKVHTEMWDRRIIMFNMGVILTERLQVCFEALRTRVACWTRRRVLRTLREYLRHVYGIDWVDRRLVRPNGETDKLLPYPKAQFNALRRDL